jgi:hypothetical protein
VELAGPVHSYPWTIRLDHVYFVPVDAEHEIIEDAQSVEASEIHQCSAEHEENHQDFVAVDPQVGECGVIHVVLLCCLWDIGRLVILWLHLLLLQTNTRASEWHMGY